METHWTPYGARGQPALPRVLSKLTGLPLPHVEVAAWPRCPVPYLLLLRTRSPGSVLGYELLQKGCWREEGGCQTAKEVLRKICCLWLKDYQKCLGLEPGKEGQAILFLGIKS